MNPFNLAKSGAQILVSIGAGAVVGNAIKTSIPASSNLLQKISIGVGGFVLSSMVGDIASAYTARNIDNTAAAFKQAKNPTPKPESDAS